MVQLENRKEYNVKDLLELHQCSCGNIFHGGEYKKNSMGFHGVICSQCSKEWTAVETKVIILEGDSKKGIDLSGIYDE